MKSLDRTRDYGSIFGGQGEAAYEQDHCYFKADGSFLKVQPGFERQAEAARAKAGIPDTTEVKLADGTIITVPRTALATARPATEPKKTETEPAVQTESDADETPGETVEVAKLSWPDLRKVGREAGAPADMKRDDVLEYLNALAITTVLKTTDDMGVVSYAIKR
jgi:hypothetical protein